VLDPLGASPQLAVEIAAHGYRTLVAVNNPVTRFLLELAAQPPSQADLRAALSELAAARKGRRTPGDSSPIPLSHPMHQMPAASPGGSLRLGTRQRRAGGRIYHCPCGDSGEYPATPADQARAASLASLDGLHRARLLERVAAPDDPDRPTPRKPWIVTCRAPSMRSSASSISWMGCR
jgi:hypothetical protein